MKYIDTFKNISPSQLLSETQKNDALCEARVMIAKSHEMLDDLISWKENNLQLIAQYSDLKNPIFLNYVNFLKKENDLFEIHGQLMLYYGDIMIAYKNMVTIYDDWEFRVHVRRIYTLLYEILNGFCKYAGKPIGYLKGTGEREILDTYNLSIKKLREYLEENKSDFYSLRNKTEAHKDKDIDNQIKLIENISIKNSFTIVETTIKKLNNVLVSMTPLFKMFNLKSEELLNSIEK